MTSEYLSAAQRQHQLLQEIYVLMDDGDRRVLEEARLSPLEFALLRLLDPTTGQRLTDLGVRLLCVKSTITRLVDRLEHEGLVQRAPDPDDRRAQRLVLTPRGAIRRSEAISIHSAALEQRMAVLAPDEQAALTDLLAKLRDGMRTSAL